MPESKFTQLVDTVLKLGVSPGDLLMLAEAMRSPEYIHALGDPFTDTTPLTSGHVVMVSGGADSMTAYRLATLTGQPVTAVYINMGQGYAGEEIGVVESLGIDVTVVDTPGIYNQYNASQHILPARNLICLDIAAQLGSPGWVVWFGAVNGETPDYGGDKSQAFIGRVRQYLSMHYSMSLRTLQHRTKAEWARWWITTQPDPETLLKTVTCYHYDGVKHCGTCQGCLRRYCAMVLAGYEETAVLDTYHKPPLAHATDAVDKYSRLMWDELSGKTSPHYGHRRCMQMLTVLTPDRLPPDWRWTW